VYISVLSDSCHERLIISLKLIFTIKQFPIFIKLHQHFLQLAQSNVNVLNYIFTFFDVFQQLDLTWKESEGGIKLFLDKLFKSFAVWSDKEAGVEANVEHLFIIASTVASEVTLCCISERIVSDYFGPDEEEKSIVGPVPTES